MNGSTATHRRSKLNVTLSVLLKAGQSLPMPSIYPATLMSKQLLDTGAKHPFSVAGLADRTWHFVSETAFRAGWTPLTGLAEAAVVS